VVQRISSNLRVREGDFIETVEGLIFDVKGLVHPPGRAIAFLRYYPSPNGKRERDGLRYDKVYHLTERFDYLREHYPHYLQYDKVFGTELQSVPHSFIRKIYHPKEQLLRLRELEQRDALQQDVVTFADIIEEKARISADALGISGSVQVDLHGETSDIDLIVYGRREARTVQLALRRAHLIPEEGISGYRLDTYRSVYNLRWSGTGIPIERMLLVDGLKSMHGVFGGHHYFIRAILDWDEMQEEYGDCIYEPIGQARAQCTISDDRDGLFTPCRYEIDDVVFLEGKEIHDVREIVSFRGRFAEQVRQDETVVVQGMVEIVKCGKEKWGRFLLGAQPTDILLPSNII
jgi:predicted nucleotidyltransferase